MLQVAISGGEIRVVDVPLPALRPGALLVRTSHSLISAGTESSGLASGGRREPLLVKALRNPSMIRTVMRSVASRGLPGTAALVRSRIVTEQALGYSLSGVVLEVAPDVTGFQAGDRVACCGAGHANHAAVNVVPHNLAAKLPDGATLEEAAFGTLGAIALQGVRRCAPTLGDRIVVLGLGLLGQLTVQLLRASGALTIGVDVRAERVERARALGMEDGFAGGERDLVAGVMERTEGRGADAVVVTAATKEAGLLDQALAACRRKGRLVLVGDVPIRMSREHLYRKEIDFLISTSYGPGRYDADYEEKGRDYPFAYVRWTEGRNLAEVVRRIASGSLNVKALIDSVVPVERAAEAYAALGSERRPIGIVLDFHLEAGALASASETSSSSRAYLPRRAPQAQRPGALGVGVVGFGGYFRGVLLPLIQRHPGFRLASVCSRSGLTVRGAVENHGFDRGTTDYRELVSDPTVDLVFVATRHDLHYSLARAAVEAGKSVFVEKPMTLSAAEGRQLVDLVAERQALLSVGFNRRFSPHAVKLKQLLRPVAAPKTLLYRVNAGQLPEGHWLLDPVEGGGRLMGEGVHFFDFLAFLTGAEPIRVRSLQPRASQRDEAIVGVDFADGSVGTLVYVASGSPAAGKERVEVFCGGLTAILDDFKALEVYGCKDAGTRTRSIDKGQAGQLENLYRALRGEESLGVTAEDGLRATWCAEQALSQHEP